MRVLGFRRHRVVVLVFFLLAVLGTAFQPASAAPLGRLPEMTAQSRLACGGVAPLLADAAILSGSPAYNGGSAHQLEVGQNTRGAARTLLSFNVSEVLPADRHVASAFLEMLLVADAPLSKIRLQVSEITAPWSEDIVTWLTQPALTSVGQPRTVHAADGVLRLDVTTLVSRWADGRAQGDLALSGPDGDVLAQLISREGAAAIAQPGVSGPRLVIACSPRAVGPAVDSTEREMRQEAAVNSLRASTRSPLELRLAPGDGSVRFASLRQPVGLPGQLDGPTKARWFLDTYKDLLRLDSPAQELQLTRRSANDEHLFFRQLHQNVPVYGATIGVHVKGDEIVAVGAQYVPDINVGATPQLTAEQASSLALSYVDPGAQLTGAPQLVYFDARLLGADAGATRLAWRVSLTGVPGQPVLLVDASTGQLLHTSWRESDGFELEYLEFAGGNTSTSCWVFASSTSWFDEDGPLSGVSPSTEGFQAFNNIKAVDSWWRGSPFFRDSYDNDGEEVEMYINVGQNWGNASYTGGICDIFQYGTGYAVRDVMAHEHSHAIDNFEGELEYVNQSGALDESFADINGHFQDPSDWLIGEDLPNSSTACNAPVGGEVRDMANPARCGDPDHMSATFSSDGVGLRTTNNPECDRDEDDYNDCGFVHTNSGIHNKVAHLLVDGGTHPGSGVSVSGIGSSKAKRLFYAVLTSFMFDTAQLIHARDAALLWSIVYGPAYGFTSSDVCSVRNAYAAVGLGIGDMDCDGAPDNVDPDSDNDGVPNGSDNCPTSWNSAQTDSDNDGLGDICDNDKDGDGVSNATDNCLTTHNPNQANWNGDGQGDACDDSDLDGHLDSIDNCRSVANHDQADLDLDGIGDVCDSDRDGDGIVNSSDNCADHKNADQADTDADGVGNACDLCPNVSSPDNGDPDEDGLGNPCDPDDDNDGLLDEADNCPQVPNPEQIDLDQNGIGLACDDAERERFVNSIKKHLLQPELFADAPWRLPVPICPECGPMLPQDFRVLVDIQFDQNVSFFARVVDGQGKLVGKAYSKAGAVHIAFNPAPHSSSTFFGGVAGPRGRAAPATGLPAPADLSYTLEILPAPGTDLAQPLAMEVAINGGVTHTILLPVIGK